MNALLHDRRGSLLLESFVAFVPIFLLFVLLCQMTDLGAHQLIVQRAASAAVRAAVVVLPDDGVHYGDPGNRSLHRFEGGRKQAVEAAALAVLRASPSFQPSTTQIEVGVGQRGSNVTLQLATDYTCFLSSVRLVCGLDGKVRLTANARLAYQGASYDYARGG